MPEKDNNALPGNESATPAVSPRENFPTMARDCRRVIGTHLPRLLSLFFSTLDDALFEFSENASSENAFFFMMRDMRKRQKELESRYIDGVLKLYDTLAEPPTSLPPEKERDSPPSELTLVDDNELEEELALTRMSSRAEEDYGHKLSPLNKRLAALFDLKEMTLRENPVAPYVICSEFRKIVQAIDPDLPLKWIIYRVFDRAFLKSLGNLYDELNSCLLSTGVQLKAVTCSSKGDTPAATPPRAKLQSVEAAPLKKAETPPPSQLFRALSQLISSYRVIEGRDNITKGRVETSSSPLYVYGPEDLIGALTSLQTQLSPPSLGATKILSHQIESIKEKTLQTLDAANTTGKAQGALREVDTDTIDIVGLLFEFILEDPRLPDSMRAQISRLQIPLLKVAIQDKAFFSKREHPARQLLNHIAQEALRWSQQESPSKNDLYNKICSIIDRIVNDFMSDMELFTVLNEELQQFLAQEKQTRDILNLRTLQTLEGRRTMENARQKAGEYITNLLKQQENIPNEIGQMLNTHWKELLVITLLKQGQESEAWKRWTGLAKDLLWSVAPKQTDSERRELTDRIPEIIKGLKKGLKNISVDKRQGAAFFKQLAIHHLKILRRHKETVEKQEDEDPFTTSIEVTSPGTENTVNPPLKLLQDEYLERAESVAVGAWIELKEANGDRLRLRLIDKDPRNSNLVFSDRKGRKVHEMTTHGLALYFRTGNAQEVEETHVPLVDRAFSNMFTRLKSGDVHL